MIEQQTAPPAETTGDSLRLRQSESIASLAKSFSRAQAAVEGAAKDSNNPHFKSKYADLASVWRACRTALTDNCLSIIQSPAYAKGQVIVTTRLVHDSGEWLEGTLAIPVGKSDAHGVGSAITYARRFALASMVGIAPEDDDGNAAATARQVSRDNAMVNRGRQQARPAPPPRYEEQPPVAADDEDSWEKYLTPTEKALADENDEWWLVAVKRLLLRIIGRRDIKLTRALIAWASPDVAFDATEIVTVPPVAKDFWEVLVAKSNTVPFHQMLVHAHKSAEKATT